jgi:hypothetical protein
MLDLFVASQLEEEGAPDAERWAAGLANGRSEAEKERLRAFIERLVAERAPIWQRLGALASSIRLAL